MEKCSIFRIQEDAGAWISQTVYCLERIFFILPFFEKIFKASNAIPGKKEQNFPFFCRFFPDVSQTLLFLGFKRGGDTPDAL